MKLRLKRIGIDTARENVAFLDDDDLISHALGFHPMDRIEIPANGQSIRAVLNIVEGSIVQAGTIGSARAEIACHP